MGSPRWCSWVPLCSPSRLYLTEEEKTASRFHREPIVRFRWSTVCTEIKEPSCNNSPNPDQLIQRKRGGKVSVLCEPRGCSVDKITQHYTRWLTAENRITKRETSKGRVSFFWKIRKLYLSMNTGLLSRYWFSFHACWHFPTVMLTFIDIRTWLSMIHIYVWNVSDS